VLVALSAIALAAYQGRITPPLDAAFKTPIAGFSTDVTVPCPPVDSATGDRELPLLPSQVSVRVRNATTTPGLARDALAVLTGRGYVPTIPGAINWDNRTYADSVRIQFGKDGLQQAYTVGRNFPTVDYVLDNRKGAVVDIILGAAFAVKDMRPQYAPELDAKTPLVAPLQCLPVDRITPQPAPHIIPVDPLAPSATPHRRQAPVLALKRKQRLDRHAWRFCDGVVHRDLRHTATGNFSPSADSNRLCVEPSERHRPCHRRNLRSPVEQREPHLLRCVTTPH